MFFIALILFSVPFCWLHWMEAQHLQQSLDLNIISNGSMVPCAPRPGLIIVNIVGLLANGEGVRWQHADVCFGPCSH